MQHVSHTASDKVAQAPSPYSIHNPQHQLVWDSTSLKQLQFCPRAYQYSILEGWRGSAVDLEFGIYFASGVETYKKARLDGFTKEQAQLAAVKRVVEDSWIETGDGKITGHPWGGNYETQWRCTGTTKFRNAKGNAAKCPYSHKGVWIPGHGPSVCGSCGSETESVRRYAPTNNAKNRHTLVRLIAWYCEEQPEDLTSGLHALRFPNGKPAVELSFKLPLPWQNKHGETYILAGHIDSIMTNGDENFAADNKSTKNAISSNYWKQFKPNTQVSTYDLAGSLLWPELNLKGFMIEAAQVLVDGARFGSQLFYNTQAEREEYFGELQWWLDQAERFADAGHWPMNRTNCKICTFNAICSREPAKREASLKADFVKRPWNPLEER